MAAPKAKPAATAAAPKAKVKARKKEKKNVALGNAYIKSTFNNTIVTITDPSGAVLAWASSGQVGFKGSRKSTPFAAQLAAESAAKKAQEHGVKKVDVYVKGPGSGRETAIRSLQAAGLEVGAISDVTPLAQLRNNIHFEQVKTWLRESLRELEKITPQTKDEVQLRWNQGAQQVLSTFLQKANGAEETIRKIRSR